MPPLRGSITAELLQSRHDSSSADAARVGRCNDNIAEDIVDADPLSTVQGGRESSNDIAEDVIDTEVHPVQGCHCMQVDTSLAPPNKQHQDTPAARPGKRCLWTCEGCGRLNAT